MKNVILFLILVIISALEMLAQGSQYNVPERSKKETESYNSYIDKKTKIGIYYHKIGSSAYYDLNGDLKTLLVDSNSIPYKNREYTFELDKYSVGLTFEHYIFDNLAFDAELPLSYYHLNERYLEYYDSTSGLTVPRMDKDNLDRFLAEYLRVGADYHLFEGAFGMDIFFDMKIPLGNEYGVSSNESNFWSDGAFEFSPGINLSLTFEKVFVKAGSKLNLRSEDLTNRLISRIEAGLFTVPGSILTGSFEWAAALGKYDNVREFNIRRYPAIEDYLDLGVMFGLNLAEQISTEFRYNIRLLGKNSWNYSQYNLKFIYKL